MYIIKPVTDNVTLQKRKIVHMFKMIHIQLNDPQNNNCKSKVL